MHTRIPLELLRFMCDCLPSTYKSLQPLKDGSIPVLSQENLLLNDRYRILKPLSQGGCGKTFLAIDEKYLQQLDLTPGLCVIKQFFPQNHTIHRHQKAFELFHQKSLRLAELGKHPQIPQLLDTFEQDGQQYIVQEWIDGQTLEEELAEAGAFNEAEIRQLLLEFLPVLQFVHDHWVIHRDIKPANIIRRQSSHQLVLVDFGAAKSINSPIIEKTGTLIGSAEYAAPEQIKGKAVFASDLYSLGVICLHLLTQMSPFDLHDCGEDTWIWRLHLTKPISPSLEKILCKLVQKATKRRYTSATEVLKDLNHLPKHVVPSKLPTRAIANNDDFETPYFGFSIKESLTASINPHAAALDIRSIASVTVFDRQRQAWYNLTPQTNTGSIAQKVAAFLSPRLAATACTQIVQDKLSPEVANTTNSNSNKIFWKFLTAITATCIALFTIAYLSLGIQSHLTSTTWKVENVTFSLFRLTVENRASTSRPVEISCFIG